MCFWFSSLMPIPLSVTEKYTSHLFPIIDLNCNSITIRPFLVNLIAFDTKLLRICVILVISPFKNWGRSSSIITFNWLPFSSALILLANLISFISNLMSKSLSANIILPSSILLKSSTSFIRLNKLWADTCNISRYSTW